MGRTLSSGSTISHYNVISPLAVGGMGEVYIARDQSLDRSVALKVLPPELVRDEERVRRFIQEAKAASALSHPHIVTIYEIGQGEMRTADSDSHHKPAGETAIAGPIHFIAMELVAGETIGYKIHHEKTELRTLLAYLAQAADGLAKAHAAGIVHRDLKPENIMVTRDGYAKVLDFGLAKLTEREVPGGDATIVSPGSEKTIEGAVLGTVGYMSPEQVQGKSVDPRADIFAFGCILYEAATRRRAFKADSDVETMHQILREEPVPIEELNPDTPAELRRLIRRCLAKSPDQRLQSMKDLALELREIADEYPSLPLSSSSRISGGSAAVATRARRRPGARIAAAAAIVLVLGGLALGIWALGPWRKPAEAPVAGFQSMQMNRLTTHGDVQSAALSPDGRYLAQVRMRDGRWSLWVRQIATGSEVEAVSGQATEVGDVSFSPDGDYLYFRARDPETPNYSALFQVASLGGTPRKVLFDVDTAVSFSPDGRQMAFLRGYPQIGETALMLANADGSSERKLAVEKWPSSFETISGPSWSPDGNRIAVAVSRGPFDVQVATVAVADGKSAALTMDRWIQVEACAWLPDNTGLVVSALGFGGSLNKQIWEIAYPRGRVRRITNDLNDYNGVSITADAKRIATVQSDRIANLWVAPAADPAAARQITSGASNEEAISDFAMAADGRIVFQGHQDRFLHLFSIASDGSGRKLLTSGPSFEFQPQVAPVGGAVAFTSFRGEQMTPHIYTMDLEGGNLVQLTNGSGEVASGIDPRGRWALYSRVDSSRALWRVPLSGGPATAIVPSTSGTLGYSPDGERIAYLHWDLSRERARVMLSVIPAAGGAPLVTLPAPAAQVMAWAPAGDAVDYVREVDGKWNLWRQPLAGGEPRRLTDFASLRIFHFHWSPDGQQLVLSRGDVRTDVVALSDFR